MPSLTCAGRSLPQQISSHGNTNSPTASTETTAERKRQFGRKGGGGGEERHYTSLSTQANTGLLIKCGFTVHKQKCHLMRMCVLQPLCISLLRKARSFPCEGDQSHPKDNTTGRKVLKQLALFQPQQPALLAQFYSGQLATLAETT